MTDSTIAILPILQKGIATAIVIGLAILVTAISIVALTIPNDEVQIPGQPIINKLSPANASAILYMSYPGGESVDQLEVTAYYHSNGAQHQFVRNTDSVSPIIIDRLVNKQEYNFTVVALNKAGKSEPSQISETIIPLHPDYAALAHLYLGSNGPAWKTHTGWLSDEPYCTWFGVSCDDGKITGLHLPENNLDGSVPVELGALSSLKDVNFFNNKLAGSIPASMAVLNSLTSLQLGFNQFAGAVPGGVGRLRNLKFLDLRGNQLTSMPTSANNALYGAATENQCWLANNPWKCPLSETARVNCHAECT